MTDHSEAGRILLVDDENDLRLTLQDRLTGQGFVTAAFASGEEALKALQSQPFDILLTDLMMPGMSGLDLLRAALSIDPDLACILMTGQATVPTAVEALKAGAFDYVTKPFKLAALRPVLSRAIDLRRLRTQNMQLKESIAVYELSQSVACTLDVDTILAELLSAAVQLSGAVEGCVLLHSDAQAALSVAAVAGEFPSYVRGSTVPIGGSLAGWVAENRTPLAIHADDGDSRFPSLPSGTSVAAAPLIAGGALLGVLHVSATGLARAFTPGRVKALSILAGTGAAALANARLFSRAQQEIKERKTAEESARALNERLEQALADLATTQARVREQERLRALGQMASGIAHDFNNTLTPIVGFTDLLLQPGAGQSLDEIRRYLTMINVAARDAAQIVSRLKEFYRERTEVEPVCPVQLSTVVGQAAELTQPKWRDQAAANGRQIEMNLLLDDAPAIMGDPAQLREMLTNLIFNAVDAMPDGGAITLRTALQDAWAIVEVGDTGTGMSDEVRRRCMEPFFTTKGSEGTGLGLPMVYGIVQRHGGTVDVESRPGQSTTFRISFPAMPADGNGSVEHHEELLRVNRPLKVLLVDDEPSVQQVTATYLAVDGHSVELADDGAEALRKFRPGSFDLVITDNAMPGMSGERLATEIRELAPAQPILLLTGFATTSHQRGELPPSVDRTVLKPLTLSSLRAALASVRLRTRE